MYDILKKIVVAGLDAQDKVIDLMDEMIKKGKIKEEDREKLLKEIDKKFGDSKGKGEELVNEIVDTITKKNPFVSKKEVSDLEKKIQSLEKKISSMEGKSTAPKKPAAPKKPVKPEVTTPPEVPDATSNM